MGLALTANLSEQLLSLGRAQQYEGDHPSAVDSFNRAMHISRINEGLYSLNQVPIIERLIESHVARGDWEEANKSHDYLYWLHKRNYGEDDPRLLPAINKLSEWHLSAYSMNLKDGMFQHLINAHRLFRMATSIISRHYGSHDMRMIDPLRGLAVSNYYYYPQSEHQARAQRQLLDPRASSDDRLRLEHYVMNSYSSGKKAINRMRDIYASNPNAPLSAEAEAQIELADWHMLFDRWHSAMKLYKEAYNTLATNPDTSQRADELFARPVALPAMALLHKSADTPNPEAGGDYIVVNFDVSEYGRVKNIDILESQPPEKTRPRIRVRQVLKEAKFRPRFENGEPVITKNLTHRYVYAPIGYWANP